jgi:hypothetical protein
MDIVHTVITLQDQFSGCTERLERTVSAPTFDKMKAGIGTIFAQFDKAKQIRYTWKVIDVKQA